MLPDIKKILYLTDLSNNASYVFQYAIRLAQSFDANITILHVIRNMDPAMEVPIISQMGEDAYQNLAKEKTQETIERIKAHLQQFTEQELQNDPASASRVASILVLEGEPISTILETADKLESDLLVMGDHSKGVLAYTFLGSTAEKVLRRSRRPILVVPLRKK